jgi:Domain of unknown function (DUF4177)
MTWEYKTIALAAHGFLGGKLDYLKFESMLNELGRAGWELVNALDTSQGYGATRDVIAVFKRRTAEKGG